MKKEYDIEKVIELRDSQNLKWKEIEEIIGVSACIEEAFESL